MYITKFLLSLAFLSLVITSNAQKIGIQFEDKLNWEQIKAKAKAENKYILIDAFATWCGPCRIMQDSVFSKQKVGELVNESFIALKIQMDSTQLDNQYVVNWRSQAKKMRFGYNITGYPTLLFFDPRGNIIHKTVGGMADTSLTRLLEDVKDPNKQYYTLLNRYKTKELDYNQMTGLANIAKALNDNLEANAIANDYISNYLLKLDKEKLFTKNNLYFIAHFMDDINSRAFDIFTTRSAEVNAVIGKDQAQYAVKRFITRKYLPKESNWNVNKPNWVSIEKAINLKFGEIGLEAVYGQAMWYYFIRKDWINYGKYYSLYFKKALRRPDFLVNDMTWFVFLNVHDKKILSFACDVVMKYAIQEWYQTDAQSYDTFANLLYKTGKKDAAIEWEQKALKLGKGNPNLEKQFTDTLLKMKEGVPTWDK